MSKQQLDVMDYNVSVNRLRMQQLISF